MGIWFIYIGTHTFALAPLPLSPPHDIVGAHMALQIAPFHPGTFVHVVRGKSPPRLARHVGVGAMHGHSHEKKAEPAGTRTATACLASKPAAVTSSECIGCSHSNPSSRLFILCTIFHFPWFASSDVVPFASSGPRRQPGTMYRRQIPYISMHLTWHNKETSVGFVCIPQCEAACKQRVPCVGGVMRILTDGNSDVYFSGFVQVHGMHDAW